MGRTVAASEAAEQRVAAECAKRISYRAINVTRAPAEHERSAQKDIRLMMKEAI